MFRILITAYAKNYMTHIYTLCAQNREILNVKTNGTNSNHYSSKDHTLFSLWSKHLFQLILVFMALSSAVQKHNGSRNSLLLNQQLHKAKLSGEAAMSLGCWRNSLLFTEQPSSQQPATGL
jgi:hypothetical protein